MGLKYIENGFDIFDIMDSGTLLTFRSESHCTLMNRLNIINYQCPKLEVAYHNYVENTLLR